MEIFNKLYIRNGLEIYDRMFVEVGADFKILVALRKFRILQTKLESYVEFKLHQ